MSFPGENAGVSMDPGDGEGAEPQCGPEDPDGGSLEAGPSLTSLSSAHTGPKVVARDPDMFRIHDLNHKVLVLDSGTLIAVTRKSYILPETFFVLPSRFSAVCEQKGSPILLAVSKGDLCLCCDMDSRTKGPSLLLKKKKLTHLAACYGKKIQPFTFYRAKVGSWNTLESAAHPGWFISTRNSGEPVEMTDHPGQKRNIEFSLEPVYKVGDSWSSAQIN